MNEFTESHFQAWLRDVVFEEDIPTVEAAIRALVAEHPDLLETRSWREMRRMTER